MVRSDLGSHHENIPNYSTGEEAISSVLPWRCFALYQKQTLILRQPPSYIRPHHFFKFDFRTSKPRRNPTPQHQFFVFLAANYWFTIKVRRYPKRLVWESHTKFRCSHQQYFRQRLATVDCKCRLTRNNAGGKSVLKCHQILPKILRCWIRAGTEGH